MKHLAKRLALHAVAVGLTLAAAVHPAAAQVTWDWSFGGFSGQFTTDGSASGNVAAAGTYNLTDFSVTSGATVGSVSGGQYAIGGFTTNAPYAMDWSGSAPAKWNAAGSNTFDWWVFQNVGTPNMYVFFGWESGNFNTVDQAAYYDANQPCCGQPSAQLTVNVASPVTATPEPATYALMATGLIGIAAVARRRRA